MENAVSFLTGVTVSLFDAAKNLLWSATEAALEQLYSFTPRPGSIIILRYSVTRSHRTLRSRSTSTAIESNSRPGRREPQDLQFR